MTATTAEPAVAKNGSSPASASTGVPNNPLAEQRSNTQPTAQPAQSWRKASHASDPLAIAIEFMDEYADVFEELAK